MKIFFKMYFMINFIEEIYFFEEINIFQDSLESFGNFKKLKS